MGQVYHHKTHRRADGDVAFVDDPIVEDGMVASVVVVVVVVVESGVMEMCAHTMLKRRVRWTAKLERIHNHVGLTAQVHCRHRHRRLRAAGGKAGGEG